MQTLFEGVDRVKGDREKGGGRKERGGRRKEKRGERKEEGEGRKGRETEER